MKYKYKFSITALVLAVYLISINHIISLISPDKALRKENISNLFVSTDYVRAGIDGLVEQGNTLEEISITGWAFAENNSKVDDNKKVYVLLKGTDNTYISSSAKLFDRSDIYSLFCENISMAGNKNGFTINISTYNLKDGYYDVYIYCDENDTSKGLYKTSSVLEKKGKRIQAVNSSTITHLDESVIKSSDTVSFGFDSISISNGMLQITGWALDHSTANENTEYYIQISYENQTSTYTTNTFSRYDVNTQNNIENNEVGFYCSIPLIDLPSEIDIQVIIKENNKYVLSTKAQSYRIINNNFIEEFFTDTAISSFDFFQKYDSAETYTTHDVVFKVDSIKESVSSYTLDGWGTMFHNELDSCDYYLLLESSNNANYYWRLTRNKRSDIADAYGDEHLLSGFTAEIGKEYIQEGENKVYLLVVRDNCIWTSPDTVTILYKDNQLLLQ